MPSWPWPSRTGWPRWLVTDGEGERTGIPPLALRAVRDRERRLGVTQALVERYRKGKITRLRNGREEPFEFTDLDSVHATHWLEIVLPQRLFCLEPASEEDLRASMPGLFAPP